MEEPCFYGTFNNPVTKKDTWEYVILDHERDKLEHRISTIQSQVKYLHQHDIMHEDTSLDLDASEHDLAVNIKAMYETQTKVIELTEDKREITVIGKAYQATIMRYGEIYDTFNYLLQPIVDHKLN